MSAPVPSPSLSLLCGGDVAPVRQPVDALADHVQPLLDSVDFRFLQCERTYSQRGAFPDWQTIPPGRWSRLDEDYASVFKAAKADVVSLAARIPTVVLDPDAAVRLVWRKEHVYEVGGTG